MNRLTVKLKKTKFEGESKSKNEESRMKIDRQSEPFDSGQVIEVKDGAEDEPIVEWWYTKHVLWTVQKKWWAWFMAQLDSWARNEHDTESKGCNSDNQGDTIKKKKKKKKEVKMRLKFKD